MNFEIEGKRVGDGCPVLVVAELSANHGGSLERALESVRAAAEAGADAIKLQTYTPDTLTLKSDAEPFRVRTKNAWEGRTLYDLYQEAMTPWEWHAPLRDAAHAHGLVFFSTPFDATATEFLAALDAPAYKIASFELTDLPLVEHVARRGKPMIISTGMATLGEIEAAVNTCREAGNERIALLRCVSAYPAQPASMNLASFHTLKSFQTAVGLSDHTRDSSVAIASVALGAKVIEKHFIVDRRWGGPDSFFSLEPAEFRSMVDAIRATESALGAPRFGPSSEERPSLAFRRSLFVARDVEAGKIITCDDVRSVRPSWGLPPHCLPAVLGRRAMRQLRAGAPLGWADVGEPPVRSGVQLRSVDAADESLLLRWRNDSDTRAMSVNPAEVTEERHRQWFKKIMARSGDVHLWVGEREGRPVGQIRFDASGPRTYEVSLTVAPEARGHGVASSLLAEAEARGRELGAVRLIAKVRKENERSLRVFRTAGFYSFVTRSEPTGTYLWCERRIQAFEARSTS